MHMMMACGFLQTDLLILHRGWCRSPPGGSLKLQYPLSLLGFAATVQPLVSKAGWMIMIFIANIDASQKATTDDSGIIWLMIMTWQLTNDHTIWSYMTMRFIYKHTMTDDHAIHCECWPLARWDQLPAAHGTPLKPTQPPTHLLEGLGAGLADRLQPASISWFCFLRSW